MNLKNLDFFITEAFSGIRRSKLMAFISIATISVSLIIFGIFLLLTFNLNNLVNFVVSKIEIRVYLKDNISPSDLSEFENQIRSLENVKSVTLVDKNTAWKEFHKQFGNININDLLEENPLPNTLKIKLNDTHDIQNTLSYLSGYPQFIDDISYGDELAKRIQLFADFAKYAGLGLVLLLSFATLLIIVNTVRLTVIARQDEITIMQLVGATNQFIEWPFLIEGLIIGLIGSGTAVLFLKIGYNFFSIKFQESIPYFPLIFDNKVLYPLFGIVFATGTILGIFGAFISVSRTLKKNMNPH